MLKDGISVTVSFMKIRFSTRFWRESRAGSGGGMCPGSVGVGAGPGHPPDLHSLGSAGSESTGWGGAGWGLQQLQGEAEEMTVRGLERSREAHKVLLGLLLVPVHSFPGLAPAQLSRFKDRGPGCAQ